MHDELMTNMSRHFLHSILTHNQVSWEAILETVSESKSGEIGNFLTFLSIFLTDYFFKLEADLKGYDKVRVEEMISLRNANLEANLEELS